MTGFVAGAFWWYVIDERLHVFVREFSEPGNLMGTAIYCIAPAVPAILCGRIMRLTAVRVLTVTLTTAAIGHVCGGGFIVAILSMNG